MNKGEEIFTVTRYNMPADGLHILPDELSFAEGAIVESVACPAGSILKLGITLGETVFVQGAGPAGLAYIQLVKTNGRAR